MKYMHCIWYTIYDFLSWIHSHITVFIRAQKWAPHKPPRSSLFSLEPPFFQISQMFHGGFPNWRCWPPLWYHESSSISLKPVFLPFLRLKIPILKISTITMSFSRWTAGLLVLIMPWQVSQDVLLQQHQWCGARQSRRRLDVVDTALTEEGSWGATVRNMHLWVCSEINHGDFWLEHFWFFHILGIITPTDQLRFFRGVQTTNQMTFD